MSSRVQTFVLAACVVLAGCDGGSPPAPPDLSGVWAVTATFRDTTCPEPMPGTGAFTWMLSSDGAGAYSLVVQGDTKFPKATGALDGATLKLTGNEARPMDSVGDPQSQWRVRLEGGQLVGEQIVSTYADRAPRRSGNRMCTDFFDVMATRQSK